VIRDQWGIMRDSSQVITDGHRMIDRAVFVILSEAKNLLNKTFFVDSTAEAL
jgi:hypothetical protein